VTSRLTSTLQCVLAVPVKSAARGAELSLYLRQQQQQRANLSFVWAAGKSTLLNALLGSMLLPSSNVPETARITRITHTPLAEGQPPRLIYTTATGESREILGEYAIRAPLPGGRAAGSLRPRHQTHECAAASHRARLHCSTAASEEFKARSFVLPRAVPACHPIFFPSPGQAGCSSNRSTQRTGCAFACPCAAARPRAARRGAGEHLRFLNREVRARSALQSDEAFLDVQAPLAALAAAPAAAAGAEPGGGARARAALPLCLLDTPGPNEAGEDGLRFQARRPRACRLGM